MGDAGRADSGQVSAQGGEVEALYRALFESAPVAMLLVDENGARVAANRTASELLGLDATSPDDPSVVHAVPPPWDALLACAASQGEFAYRLADGAERVLEYRRVERVGHTYSLIILNDATGRVLAERRLAVQETRFQAMLEHSSDAIAIFDPSGKVMYASPEAERILGRSAGALVGRDSFEDVLPEDRDQAREAAQPVFECPGASGTVRTRVVRADGRVRWIEAAIRNATDVPEIGGIISNWRDITDRVRADETARAQEAHIRRLARMEDLARLAGGIAHDFNNLLSVVLGGLELALQEKDLGQAREDLADALGAAKRAAKLTRQLLAFGRRQVLQPRSTDLGGALEAMRPLIHRVVGEDVEVVMHVAPHLPLVEIDPTQFEQVVLNLVVNAKDAMPAGGRLTLELSTREGAQPGEVAPRPFVALSVADSGTGMDEETKARLFEPFFTTKPEGRGTGLGLATVFGVIHQSGGQILVDTAPGQGTCFTLLFPSQPSSLTPRSSVPAPAMLAPAGSETVLVVDDDAPVRATAVTVLRRSGYAVLEAESAGDALLASEQHVGKIHCVIADVVMRRMSGPALLARLRASRPDVRALYVSGYTDEALRERGFKFDDPALLAKPFTPGDLLGRLRAALDAP